MWLGKWIRSIPNYSFSDLNVCNLESIRKGDPALRLLSHLINSSWISLTFNDMYSNLLIGRFKCNKSNHLQLLYKIENLFLEIKVVFHTESTEKAKCCVRSLDNVCFHVKTKNKTKAITRFAMKRHTVILAWLFSGWFQPLKFCKAPTLAPRILALPPTFLIYPLLHFWLILPSLGYKAWEESMFFWSWVCMPGIILALLFSPCVAEQVV